MTTTLNIADNSVSSASQSESGSPMSSAKTVSNNIPPRLPPPNVRALSNVNRPPLERASSVPERAGSTSSCSSLSRTSIEKNYGSGGFKDRKLRERSRTESNSSSRDMLSQGRSRQFSSGTQPEEGSAADLLQTVDKNNVPQIDQAITPPETPSKVCDSGAKYQSSSRTNGGAFPKLCKRIPSLKFRLNRMGSMRSEKDSAPSSPSSFQPVHNPTITITMENNQDDDSVISDYLSPDRNYKKDAKIQFIGDDISLYGTPKEELSPLKEVENKPSSTSYLKDQIISFFQPSDNKLAMKLFGNKNALMKEKMRQKAVGNWVIHPCSNFRYVYVELGINVTFIARSVTY